LEVFIQVPVHFTIRFGRVVLNPKVNLLIRP
jgi:hypothetical protein